ncbi:MAG: DUF86 domain-containing protein, partial [Bacteroidota bacterium]
HARRSLSRHPRVGDARGTCAVSDRLYLDHILNRIERIERYVENDRDLFLNDEKTQDAVLRSLQTLAESTQRLSDEIKQSYPGTDWRAISGFRNVIVHNYLGLSTEQVWIIVSRDLPALKATVETMREELDDR